jgi:hypothetical protein
LQLHLRVRESGFHNSYSKPVLEYVVFPVIALQESKDFVHLLISC